jgi:hypothetical protein
MDVVSLYTNIPHSEGIEWVSEFYDETLPRWHEFNVDIVPIDKQSLSTLLGFILDNCTFEFNGRFYKQNFGTTMGAIFSVKYANIYICTCGSVRSLHFILALSQILFLDWWMTVSLFGIFQNQNC